MTIHAPTNTWPCTESCFLHLQESYTIQYCTLFQLKSFWKVNEDGNKKKSGLRN